MAEPCRNGKHSLEKVLSAYDSYGVEMVARWCSYCGGVVVDIDLDGRTLSPGGEREMQFPQIARDLVRAPLSDSQEGPDHA